MNTNSQNKKSLQFRILLTLGLLSLVRFGSFIPVPYLDRESFTTLLQTETSSTNAFAKALNRFSGTGNNSFGLLSLGILPYINASILVQLLTAAIPSFSKMQKEEGEYGRRKINQYVRYLTLFWSILESISLTYTFRTLIFDWGFWTAAQISLSLISGSMIVLWFSELITKSGLGNGSSLLICFNIVVGLPDELKAFLFSLKEQANPLQSCMVLGIVFSMTTIGCIYINEATIRIPLVSARQLLKKAKTKPKNLGNTSLPLKVNQAGVMPLVFTSYAMVLLSFLANTIRRQQEKVFVFNSLGLFSQIFFLGGGKLFYWAIYAALIFFFTYFYSTIVLAPKDIAEQLRKSSVVILGIGPGNATKKYLRKTLRRIARLNAVFLIVNIVALQLVESLFNLHLASLRGLGFTSQLILVSVLIDTLKRIRSFSAEEENVL